ncbi:MAG: adenylate/guanylate cyclase domain-containing protein [Magnetococcus sp. DMHC-1]|nr:adenylate/guanylate cyclase domain-containing protein [Magnetococcales bacterium]
MRENKRLSIMFADIAGSTRLYEQLGDVKAREITSRCIQIMSNIVAQYQGRVVKTIGDEVMCTFPTADDAGEAAIRMQEELAAKADTFEATVKIRIGFHFGEVIEESDAARADVFGDAVNLAARMAAQSKADQIITTGETLEHMNPGLRVNSRMLISTTVKGKQKPVDIYELTWGEEEELTIMGGIGPGAGITQAPKIVLTVTYQGQDIAVGEELSSITMGRGKQNNLMVPDTMASRIHARIEFRRDRFLLVDQSTNGTYVTSDKGETAFVHRDERRLSENGVIGLGQKVHAGHEMAVRYVIGMK